MPQIDQRVVLIRHGATEWSVSGQHTGRTDIPLTDAGRAAAKRLGARLAGERFALVLSSPLARAAETCRIAVPGADRAELTDDLMEWDYGAYEGRRTADIRQERPGWLLWTDGVPDGETIDEVAARVDRVIARARDVGGDVALCAHGHVLRVLAARWLAEPPTFGGRLKLDTAALSILAWDRELPALVLWNDTSHLTDAGDPADPAAR
jgi:broad specificity phosphatase PhoE